MEEKNLQPEELKKQELQEETKSETTESQAPVVEESSTEEVAAVENEKPDSESIVETDRQEDSGEVLTDDKDKNPVAAAESKESSEEDNEHDEEQDEEEDEVIPDSFYDDWSREQLVEELESLVQEDDINNVKRKVGLVKMAYLKITREAEAEAEDENQSIPENAESNEDVAESEDTTQDSEPSTSDTEVKDLKDTADQDADDATPEPKKQRDPLTDRYRAAFKIYKTKREKYLIELEEQKIENLKAKQDILDKLKGVISSEEPLKKSYDDFRELQEQWREIGMVPKTEVNNLWQNYHFLVEKFFDKVKINNELRDLGLKKNLETKIQLCEAAEELLLETSIIKSFKQLQELHKEWKETGPVPTDKKDELWERFKTITDKINARRREHYTRIREDQENNHKAKIALCEQVEEIVNADPKGIKDWNTKTDSVNEMLRVWKTIGPAPKTVNDEIWGRFKGNLDAFFEKKKDFFNKLKEQQVNNYNLKLDLCNQAEGIKDSEDWKETTKALIDMQKKWKSIGPVPKKYSDKVWKRFRAACDEFFNRKEEFFGHIHEHEAENLTKKRDLVERLKNQEFGGKKSENLTILKEFQREWMSIGHVPIKEKDAIQKSFRDVVDEKLEQLKINEMEISTMNFKNRIDNIKDNSDSGRIMSRERNQLMNKITKLNDDINLWENNIGFLAESKNANLLKREFEKKIQRAKQDVALLNAKLKYLNDHQ